MDIKNLIIQYPNLQEYVKNMPLKYQNRCFIKKYKKGQTIHFKNDKIEKIGIIVKGTQQVINILENGNIYIIEKNAPISFIGEVTLLAGKEKTSVTIQSIDECVVIYWSLTDFKNWLSEDLNILQLVAKSVAKKLYRKSYTSGERLFYPTEYIVLKYIKKYYHHNKYVPCIVKETRETISQELGMSIKTLNRAIKKLCDKNLIYSEKGKIAVKNIESINDELKLLSTKLSKA